jgi:hypothetical protein
MNHYRIYSDVHGNNSRLSFDPYQHLSRFPVSQKGTFDMSIKVLNRLPSEIKNLNHDIKQFKRVLKKYSLFELFLCIEEVFSLQ